MKYKTFQGLLPFVCSTAVTACSKNADLPDTAAMETKNGVVAGMVTDSKNLPVKSASITIEHTVWYNSYLLTASNDEGKYEVSLPNDPAGDWTAKAQLTKTAYWQTYKFDLEPDNIGAFSHAFTFEVVLADADISVLKPRKPVPEMLGPHDGVSKLPHGIPGQGCADGYAAGIIGRIRQLSILVIAEPDAVFFASMYRPVSRC